MNLDQIALELRPLLVAYCAESAPTLRPTTRLDWDNGMTTLAVGLLDRDNAASDWFAHLFIFPGDYATAEKVLEALIIDRHKRAKAAAEAAAAERTADDDFREIIAADAADVGEPE